MLSVTEHKEIEFSADLISKFEEIVTRYPEGKQKSALLPVLHLVQAEYGWVSPEAMEKIAAFLQDRLGPNRAGPFGILQPLADAGKISLPSAHAGHSWQTFMVVLSGQYNRDELVVKLREKGIETSLGAQSLSSLAIYPNHWNDAHHFEEGSTLYKQGLALPFCELYSAAELQQVVDALTDLL